MDSRLLRYYKDYRHFNRCTDCAGCRILYGISIVAGAKTIRFTVIAGDETIKSIDIHTDAEYLRQALEEDGLVEGEEGTYGLWVTTVAGRTADSSKEEWWALYKNGEFSMTGVDDTPLAYGDSIEYRLTVGYN